MGLRVANSMSPLRILAVTNMLPTPSAPNSGRFVEQQIKALRRTSLDVDVLLINRMQKGMGVYASLPTMLRKAINQNNPHLIHVMYGGIMSWITSVVIQDRPVVATFHGSDLLGQPFERPLRRALSASGVLASRQAARKCDGVVLVAEHLAERLPKDIPSSRMRVIPCGIDLDMFKPLDQKHCRERLGWDQDDFHVIFQATGDPVKRPELAAAAIDRLRELGTKVELHYLRGIEYEQVPVWLNASDALLVTSRHEGSPTIVKEALACNLPIVSVPVGDIPRMIQRVEGCYLSVPDAMELALRLQRIRMRPGPIEGRVMICNITADHCADRLMQFYEQVLARRRGEDESDQLSFPAGGCGQIC